MDNPIILCSTTISMPIHVVVLPQEYWVKPTCSRYTINGENRKFFSIFLCPFNYYL